jgi:hypothetical protein
MLATAICGVKVAADTLRMGFAVEMVPRCGSFLVGEWLLFLKNNWTAKVKDFP